MSDPNELNRPKNLLARTIETLHDQQEKHLEEIASLRSRVAELEGDNQNLRATRTELEEKLADARTGIAEMDGQLKSEKEDWREALLRHARDMDEVFQALGMTKAEREDIGEDPPAWSVVATRKISAISARCAELERVCEAARAVLDSMREEPDGDLTGLPSIESMKALFSALRSLRAGEGEIKPNGPIGGSRFVRRGSALICARCHGRIEAGTIYTGTCVTPICADCAMKPAPATSGEGEKP